STTAAPEDNGSAESTATGTEDEMKPLVGYGSKTVVPQRRPRKEASATASTSMPTSAAPASAPPEPQVPQQVASTAAEPIGDHTSVPLAKPPVRKLAKELGVDLATVTGSAESGVITREDVSRA